MQIDFASGGRALTQEDIDDAVSALGGLEPELLWALFAKESPFLAGYMPDRRPVILYERHIFSHLTNGQFDEVHPEISGPRYAAGTYGTYDNQYTRLAEAMVLNADAALQATSWGIGQTLGEIYSEIGYPSVEAMISDIITSERAQLRAAVKEIIAKNVGATFRSKDFNNFAAKYNGSQCGPYADLLKQSYNDYKLRGCPNVDIRRTQLYLQYLGYAPGQADGVLGNNTAKALRAFQTKVSLPQSATNDTETMSALERFAFPPAA